MKLCTTITSKGENYTANVFRDDGDLQNGKPAFWFFGDADVDVDGSPNWRRDPYGQADTSLHFNGHPVNSDAVPGIVLPPDIIKLTPDIVLGCFASVEYNGKHEPAVVFDVGPTSKLGELSGCLARRLGINDNPNTGGVDTQSVHYRFWPGVPANIDGNLFTLTPLGSHHG